MVAWSETLSELRHVHVFTLYGIILDKKFIDQIYWYFFWLKTFTDQIYWYFKWLEKYVFYVQRKYSYKFNHEKYRKFDK